MSADPDTIIIEPELPGWLKALRRPLEQLGALYNEYGSLPRAVFALISAYILNGIFGFVSVIAESVLFAFDTVVGALGYTQALLISGASYIGLDILGALTGLQQAVADAVSGVGPVAPIIAVGAAAVSLYVLYRLSIALLGELPIGSSLADLLGLR